MKSELETILGVMNILLNEKQVALEFVINELSFANKSSLAVRNFANSSGVKLKKIFRY